MKTISDFLEKREKLFPFLFVSFNPWQLGDGWYKVEGRGINATCWSKESASYYLKGDGNYLVINYNVINEQIKVKPLKFKVFFNGKLVGKEEETEPGWKLRAYEIKPREINEIRIKTSIFVPHFANGGGDMRELGVMFNYSGLFKKNHPLVLESLKRKEIENINKMLKERIIKNTILKKEDFKLNLIKPV